MRMIESEQGYFLRRAGEERQRAALARHPAAAAAHRQLAGLLAREAARVAPRRAVRPVLHLRHDAPAVARSA